MLNTAFFQKYSDLYQLYKNYKANGLQAMDLQFNNPGYQTMLSGKPVISFSSNDYLSLLSDPRVKSAAQSAISDYGTGTGSSMAGSGSLHIHEKLAEELADFLGKEAAMLFPSGYSAMLGFSAFNVVNGARTYCDELNHRSILDGLLLGVALTPDRLNQLQYFRHNDFEHFKKCYEYREGAVNYEMLFVEGVYSVDGDIACLDKLIPYCKENNFVVAIDDAHGIGVLGENGRGTASHCDKVKEIDFILGTFSKSLATIGGFICGEKEAIKYMKCFCNPYIFSAALPPANVEIVRYIIKLLKESNELQEKLWNNVRYFKKCLKESDINYGDGNSAIIPIFINDINKLIFYSKELLQRGIYLSPIMYPVTKKGSERFRVCINAGHTHSQLDYLIQKLIEIRRLALDLSYTNNSR